MARSLGGTSLTTRSPMRILPSVMSSNPAIMRSAVDLPQPEGPTRTMNSLSLISTFMSSMTTRSDVYCFLTWSNVTPAMSVHYKPVTPQQRKPPHRPCRFDGPAPQVYYGGTGADVRARRVVEERDEKSEVRSDARRVGVFRRPGGRLWWHHREQHQWRHREDPGHLGWLRAGVLPGHGEAL